MPKPPDIDPAVKRALAESMAHNGESRRKLGQLAKLRGVPEPPTPDASAEFEKELDTAKHDIEELQRAARAARAPLPSEPEASVRAGPLHVRVGNVPAWMLMVTLVLVSAIAAFAYMTVHAPPASVPTPLPAHSAG